MAALYRLSYMGINKRLLKNKQLLLKLERVMGIEPTLPAWEAGVLPLNYTRTAKKYRNYNLQQNILYPSIFHLSTSNLYSLI
jgi:hypothetical protein